MSTEDSTSSESSTSSRSSSRQDLRFTSFVEKKSLLYVRGRLVSAQRLLAELSEKQDLMPEQRVKEAELLLEIATEGETANCIHAGRFELYDHWPNVSRTPDEHLRRLPIGSPEHRNLTLVFRWTRSEDREIFAALDYLDAMKREWSRAVADRFNSRSLEDRKATWAAFEKERESGSIASQWWKSIPRGAVMNRATWMLTLRDR